MFIERSTTGDAPGVFILPLATDDDQIGGKARSLARLAALELPVPSGFAIGAALFRALVSQGPPLPQRLESAADLAALQAAQDALGTTAFPTGFEEALATALDTIEEATRRRMVLGEFSSGVPMRFAVRSSSPTEDRAGTLGAGIHASILRVPRVAVADAVRRVLKSFLTPAARVYSAWRSPPGAPIGTAETSASILIHPFVDGSSAGTAAFAPFEPIRVDAHPGEPTAKAGERIDAATRAAAAQFGPVEIEWVAQGDEVTFLQLRAYHPAPGRTLPASQGTDDMGGAFATLMGRSENGGGWTWDAAHNPWPLSPAQAGLVALVDAHCRIGIRQQVVDGYLFWKHGDDPAPPTDGADARAAFDRLRDEIEPKLQALGPEPSLSAALTLYLAAYQPLFGIVGPTCVAAQKALADFSSQRLFDRALDLTGLLAGVPSAAGRRRAAANAIVTATSTEKRQAAIDDYLVHFGDESPRWDVAEPTLRESPGRLLLLGVTRSARSQARDGTGNGMGNATRPHEGATDPLRRLAPTEHARFQILLAAARAAIAVGEDDDALFARLQAGVRRALLALGRRLVTARKLDAVDDVFYLPLPLARVLDDPQMDPSVAPDRPADRGSQNLRQIIAAGREAFDTARLVPPPTGTRQSAGPIVRGRAGAGGRIVGRVVHHPSSTPFYADAVLIAATLLPTELPLLSPAAIVVETGEVLGHVAAQARERGIPAVVGAVGACAAIPEGATVIVDGDRGEVIRL